MVVAVGGLAVFFFALVPGVGLVQPAPAVAAPGCAPGVDGPVTPADSLTGEQTGNVAAIVAAGREMGVPRRGWVIAVAAAYQESTLRVLPYGDTAGPDSRGLFQQRDGWGPLEQRMDPTGSARLFYRALLGVAGWETMPLYAAAQAVQHSAYPWLYASRETLAEQAVAAVAADVPEDLCVGVVVAGWALPLPADRVVAPVTEHHDYPAADLPVVSGTPVFSMTGGRVRVMDEFTVNRDGSPGGCGHGIEVTSGGDVWLYCHLSDQLAATGATVGAGDRVGSSGSTGGSTGPHLHVQLRRDGTLTCVQPVLDALKAGRGVPARLPDTWPCLSAWAAMVAAA